jgi:hypothetical protein
MAEDFQARVKIIFFFPQVTDIDEDEIRSRFEDTVYPLMEGSFSGFQTARASLSNPQRKLKVETYLDGGATWFHVYPKLAFDVQTNKTKVEAVGLCQRLLDHYVNAFKAGFPELVGLAYVLYELITD